MRFAYLIMAHDGFDQLAALLARLLAGNDDLAFVHVDRRVGIPAALREAAARHAGRARLLDRRVACRWGHWHQLAAERLLLAAALPHAPDFLHLLSGRDWPLASRDTIAAEIARDPRCRIDVDDGAMAERMDGYALEVGLLRDLAGPAGRWRLRRAGALLSRYLPRRSRPYGAWARGSQWWSLPPDAAAHVAGELGALMDAGRLRFTACADEHVVQSILLASRFADRIAPNRRLIRWTEGMASPAILTTQDVAGVDNWFGRKFAVENDRFFLSL